MGGVRGSGKEVGIGRAVHVIVLALLSAVPASAIGQGRTASGEIIVKLRTQTTEPQTQGSDAGSQAAIPQSLEALHKRYGVRQMQPLLMDSGRREAAPKIRKAREEDPTMGHERQSRSPRRRSLTPDARLDLGRIYRIKLDAGTDGQLQELLKAYQRQPEVEYAELNQVVAICAEPNDPHYP